MVPDSTFLLSLTDSSRKLVQRHLSEVLMDKGHVVALPYSKLETAYFPVDVAFAADIELASGASFLTGIIGNDGLLGAGMSLDDRVCLYSVTALTHGRAFSMPM